MVNRNVYRPLAERTRKVAERKSRQETPGVVFQPRSSVGMRRGIDRLVAAIRPTLGPIHRNVLIEQQSRQGLPELLDNGAVIARRIIELPDRDEDMGAMYLRQLLWSMYESVGDGTATAALIFHSIYKQGLRFIAAGGDAMRLRGQLERCAPLILDRLQQMTFTLEGKEDLSRLAETICHEPALAQVLGEIFDIVGEFGQLDIRVSPGRKIEREYVEGMYWSGGLFSREMASQPGSARAELEDCAILATDLEIKEPMAMLHVLDVAQSAGIRSMLLVASSVSDRALSVLLMQPNREKVRVVATKAPAESSDERREGLEDLGILSGGRLFLQATADTLNSLKADDFGMARRAWADQDRFGITGGKGDPRRVRHHLGILRSTFAACDSPQRRRRLQERIGRLLGGSAVLSIGHPSSIAAQAQKDLAEHTAEAMRGAMRNGVLPGGGAALLACRPLFQQKLRRTSDEYEGAACRIVAHALEAPTRVLLENAGLDPVEVLNELAASAEGCGYDTVGHRVVNMAEAGIVDSGSVIAEAVSRAISGAALALTVDVLVHRSKPPLAYHTI